MSKNHIQNLTDGSNLANMLATGAALTAVTRIGEGDIPFATVIEPTGETRQESLEHLLAKPSIVRAAVVIQDVESFIRYVNLYRRKSDENLAIFANVTESGASFTAILDYHKEGSAVAEHGAHRAVYTCTPTPEWARWTAGDKKQMAQEAFAQFLEDNAPDIVSPSSAQMIEIALSLEARTTGDFKQATRLENGSLSFHYSENIEAKAGLNGSIEIPSTFEIGISPFVGFTPFKIDVRLRYRLSSGKLTFWYELVRPHKVVEESAKDVIKRITDATGLSPFRGAVQSMGLK